MVGMEVGIPGKVQKLPQEIFPSEAHNTQLSEGQYSLSYKDQSMYTNIAFFAEA
jgi:hypothetical protein